MKSSCIVLMFALSLLPTAAMSGQQPAPSPAEAKIASARKAIESNPNRYEFYNQLAMALARRARETGNPAYYTEAEKTLEASFGISPGNLEGERTHVWLLLGKHEFGQAREHAAALSKRVPDDVMTYGFLTDADAELGNYDEAESAAQWMLDLRPGNVPGLTRAAYLRELFGDIEGAIDLMQSAYQRTPPAEIEDRAWTLTQLAHLHLMIGKTNDAENMLKAALQLYPAYHYALENMAKVRTVQGRYQEAVELLRELYRVAPNPENLYPLANALKRTGQLREANATFTEFEEKALRESEKADNSNRELIFYYTDQARRPEKALRIARMEIARRHDVHTLDAYAWALYANQQYSEARKQVDAVLKVGFRDAVFFYHAGVILSKLDDRAAAEQYLQQSLQMVPQSEVSEEARRELLQLGQSKKPN